MSLIQENKFMTMERIIGTKKNENTLFFDSVNKIVG